MLLLLRFSRNANLLVGMQATIPNGALKHLDNQSTPD